MQAPAIAASHHHKDKLQNYVIKEAVKSASIRVVFLRSSRTAILLPLSESMVVTTMAAHIMAGDIYGSHPQTTSYLVLHMNFTIPLCSFQLVFVKGFLIMCLNVVRPHKVKSDNIIVKSQSLGISNAWDILDF